YGSWFLGSPVFLQTHPPDIILRFGRQPTSQVFNSYLEAHTNTFQVLVNETGRLDDATHSLDTVIAAPVARFSQAVAARLRRFTPHASRVQWNALHQQAERLTENILSSISADFTGMFEGKVYQTCIPLLPAKTRLMVSNSLPVRDLDLFAPPSEHPLQVYYNRGASGIDGITSTAAGIAAAGEDPAVLVTGDLAFLHDLTGLHLAGGAGMNLIVILIQNTGGGIFEMLPIAQFGQTYEKYVRTPHHADFAALVRGFQGHFIEADTWEIFQQAVTDSLAQPGLQVIQVRTDAKQSFQERERLRTSILQTLGEQLG
ncbi:MAG: thiamine pyrophosphate-dependent enzyme, partial [Calditrichota bacterium]